jgi:hypothetical protein
MRIPLLIGAPPGAPHHSPASIGGKRDKLRITENHAGLTHGIAARRR